MWLSKQCTGHCGIRVMVGYYSGQLNGDVSCPNCEGKETAAHLCLCLDEDRTRLLSDNANELETWMTKDGKKTRNSIRVPKYIKFRGTRAFADMGMMSPQMTALAKRQDTIGWKNFMEGRISKDFYWMQSYHLAFGTSLLDKGDWVRQFITKILQVTHSQWVYRNFLLYVKLRGLT